MSALAPAAAALLGPALALFLLAAAAVAAGRVWARRRSARLLGPGARSGGGALADLLLLGAILCVALALLGPRFGERTVLVPATGVDLVVLVDVSQSMRARDVPPSRLERARALAADVLADLGASDRAALAAFAGRGVLLTPLTPDTDALTELLPALDETLLTEGGSRFEEGLRAAVRAFRPESPRPRVVLLLSDGEDPEQRAVSGAELLGAAGARVVAVVFGSEAGAPVPFRDAPMRDGKGRIVQSRADPARLRALALPTGGALFAADAFGGVAHGDLVAAIRRDAGRAGAEKVERREPRRLAPFLAAAALAALVAEAFAARRPARRAGALLAAGTPRARRRLVSGAALAAAFALAARGAGGADGDALEAEVRGAPQDGGAIVRLGVARAQEGSLDEAQRAFFDAAVRSADPAVAADAFYDLGVAALEAGDLARARDAFFDAIALAPADRQAKFNLEWTLRALAEQKKRQRAEQQDRKRERGGQQQQEQQKQEAQPKPDDAHGSSQEQETASASQQQPPPPEEQPERSEEQHQNPVHLDPEAARRWLESVSDDPARALDAAVRGRRRAAPGQPRAEAPLW